MPPSAATRRRARRQRLPPHVRCQLSAPTGVSSMRHLVQRRSSAMPCIDGAVVAIAIALRFPGYSHVVPMRPPAGLDLRGRYCRHGSSPTTAPELSGPQRPMPASSPLFKSSGGSMVAAIGGAARVAFQETSRLPGEAPRLSVTYCCRRRRQRPPALRLLSNPWALLQEHVLSSGICNRMRMVPSTYACTRCSWTGQVEISQGHTAMGLPRRHIKTHGSVSDHIAIHH
jgi:hypothetical protein